jgi:N-acetylmuramoyl-L-alanine amidase
MVLLLSLAASPSTLSTVAEDAQAVKLPSPQRINPTILALGVRTIVLDPGHGGNDPGAVSPLGITEKELTLDISHRLRHLLEAASFEVLMTREQDDTVSLRQRVEFANSRGGDILVSIHVNSFSPSQIRGVETFYLGTTDDPVLTRLAALENRASGYSLADFHRLLEGVYLHTKQNESRQLAQALQRELFIALHNLSPRLANRGVKTAPFLVLTATDIPAILIEVSALSHAEEAQLLVHPYYRQKIAQGLFEGIHAYATAINHANKIGS